MSVVHMVCGPVGAGKTTLSRRLAASERALIFTIDEWLTALYRMDQPADPELALPWMLERFDRTEGVIVAQMQQALALGVPVVADLGFFRRDLRDRFRARIGAPVRLHVADAPVEVRRARVHARNAGGETFSVEVDDAAFRWAETYWQPPEPDEGAITAPC